MAPSTSTVVAFDLYGTLLSTGSIAEELTHMYGKEKANEIATLARRYQLEYTWRINSMGTYLPFGDLTRSSFRQATSEAKVKLSSDDEERIMKAYDGLGTFPEVGGALQTLAETPELDPYIFSNGTATMIKSSLKTSPELSKASAVLPEDKVISVDAVKVFKPNRRTYEHLVKTVGKQGDAGSVWLVSSNAFDAVGAVAAGLRSAWVDRTGQGWVDGLGDAMGIKPTVIVKGVDEAIEAIKKGGQSKD
ncbi:(S)-2-haloacid dehalogenase [Paramyrothecium foliicola]|nr:(S)-2-haloacid dehalogenase [Paramyrothecium foliicola]